MKKILVLTSTFPRWQDDVDPPFVFELCKKLSRDYEVFVLAPHCKNALISENLDGIKIIRFRYFFDNFETLCYQGGMLARLQQQPLRYLLIPLFVCAQLIAAYRLVKSKKISIIHAHWIIPQGLTATVLRYLNPHPLHILCTTHGGDLFSLKGKLFRFIKRKVLLNADALSVVSPIMAKEVNAICYPLQPRLSIIPMGIDFQNTFTLSTIERKPFSLLFVGRLVPKKGIRYLIEAMPYILEKFPQTNLTIVGDGPEYNNLVDLAAKLNLLRHINFTGAKLNNDLPAYYQTHLIAIFPFIVADNGDRDGLGLVIPEAIGCGCCIVTTDIPGMSDLITHGYSGFIVQPKNSTAISREIIRLFSNPDQINQLHSTAYEEITNKLDLNIIGEKYIDLIESIHY